MGLARFVKVRLLGHDALREAVIERLQELGVLQLADVREAHPDGQLKEIPLEEAQQALAKTQYVMELLERLAEERRGLLEGFAPRKPAITEEELERLAETFPLEGVYEQARSLEAELSRLRAEEKRLQSLREELLPWEPLAVPVEELRAGPHAACAMGRLPEDALDAFRSDCERALGGAVTFELGGTREGRRYLCAFLPADLKEEFLKCAQEHGFEELPPLRGALPGKLRGRPREILREIDREREQLAQEQGEVADRLRSLAVHKPKLQALHDYWLNELRRREVQNRLAGSPHTFVLEGWVRERDFPALQRELRALGEEIWVEPIPPEPEEEPPVALENPPLVKPAEAVVRLFGLPRPRELDPSPAVMPFFALFFGVALSDAGYGLALMALFAGLKRKFRGETFRQFANLLIAGGGVAVVAGALTGSWFGPELARLIPLLGALRVVDLGGSAGLIAFLGFALAVGFVQVLLGHALELYEGIRAGRAAEALEREGTWMLFLMSLGVLAGIGLPKLLGMPGLPAAWTPPAFKLLVLSALLVLFLSQGAPRTLTRELPWLGLSVGLWLTLEFEGLPKLLGEALDVTSALGILVVTPGSVFQKLRYALGRVGSGLFKLYGVTGFLGDVLSYSRIMALGIATGLIAMSINTFATVFARLLPETFGLPAVLGVLVALLILLVGQPLSLAINALSAFVHSARLQYVEFFTKFYESGGRPFRPFARETQYYEIQSDGGTTHK